MPRRPLEDRLFTPLEVLYLGRFFTNNYPPRIFFFFFILEPRPLPTAEALFHFAPPTSLLAGQESVPHPGVLVCLPDRPAPLLTFLLDSGLLGVCSPPSNPVSSTDLSVSSSQGSSSHRQSRGSHCVSIERSHRERTFLGIVPRAGVSFFFPLPPVCRSRMAPFDLIRDAKFFFRPCSLRSWCSFCPSFRRDSLLLRGGV